MGYALAKDQQHYIARLVKSGRFNNQSEAVREAIRRMQRQETDYLAPPPLTPGQVDAIYGRADKQAEAVGRTAFKFLKAAARKGAKP
jgi:Arc/MetJ-type ribon-helix-helix transcriptional regulator